MKLQPFQPKISAFSEVLMNCLKSNRFKGRNYGLPQTTKTIITMWSCKTFGFSPNLFDGVKFLLVLGEVFCTLTFSHQMCKCHLLILEVSTTSQHKPHVWRFSPESVNSAFLKYDPHALLSAIRKKHHFLHLPIPDRVSHSRLSTFRSQIHSAGSQRASSLKAQLPLL